MTPRLPGALLALACALAAALGLALAGPAGAQDGQAAERRAERELAQRYAPIIVLREQEEACDTKGEPWNPTPVDIVLDNPEIELRGPDGAVVKQGPGASDLADLEDGHYLNFPGNSLKPGCTYEMDFQRFAEGEPAVAYAHVVKEPGVDDRLALQYWLYYYFNDFNNTHESDWEMIQLVFPAATAEEALSTQPISAAYAQHAGGEVADWDDDKLEREGDHPVVYSAAGSHASFFGSALHLGRSASEGFGCDETRAPSRRQQLEPILLPDPLGDADVEEFGWLAFTGRWGQKEKGSFDGPTGPNDKDQWTQPITWQDGLRDSSTSIPLTDTFGPDVVEVFCVGVEAGSKLLIDLTSSPILFLLLLGAVVIVVSGVARRTRWSPVVVDPLRTGRSAGQILRTARRIYRGRRVAFVGIGVAFVPLSLLASGLQSVVLEVPPLEAIVDQAGSDDAVSIIIALMIGSFGTLIAAAVVNAAVAAAIRDEDEGRPARAWRAYRDVLRRFWPLAWPIGGTAAIIIALLAAVVTIPVAIWLMVRWLFIPHACMLDDHCGWGAAQASVRAVRGTWVRTAIFAAVLNAIGYATGPILGVVILLLTDLPLGLVNFIGSLVYVLVIPFVAICMTLMYLDRASARGTS